MGPLPYAGRKLRNCTFPLHILEISCGQLGALFQGSGLVTPKVLLVPTPQVVRSQVGPAPQDLNKRAGSYLHECGTQ